MTKEKAIKRLKNANTFSTLEENREAIDMAIEALKNVCVKGEWIDYSEDGYVECPFCHSATTCEDNKEDLHFCFWCGADMRGD